MSHQSERFRPILLATLAAAGALFLSTTAGAQDNGLKPATDQQWATVLKSACEEGTVTFYSIQQVALLQVLADDFAQAYPCIKLNWSRVITAQQIPRIQQEQTDGTDGADVFVTEAHPFLETLAGTNSLSAPTGPSGANWPAADVLENTFVRLAAEPMVIYYNTQLVSTPPEGYLSLLDPSVKGKLGTTQVLNTALLVSFYNFLDEEYGPNYLEKLAELKPGLYTGAVGLAPAIASGEISYAVLGQYSAAAAIIESGGPIGIVQPSPVGGLGFYAGITSWSKHPNAAQVLVDYLMSPRLQNLWVKWNKGILASPINVEGSREMSSVKLLNQYVTQAEVDAFTAKFNGLFTP
jgi:iron(III) transport system substrate-binding protein